MAKEYNRDQTRFVTLQGKTKWFRHTTLDPWSKWKHVLYLNPESLEKMRDLQSQGVKNSIKKDEDGWFVTLSRPSQKVFKGIVKGFTPPEVLDGTKTSPDGKHPPLTPGIMIGNGSDITTVVEVYTHKVPNGSDAKAARWLSSTVHNLVPFVRGRDFDGDQKRAVKPLENIPEPIF